MAFHWLERDLFLQEARRVLKPGGVLAICNSFFAAELIGKPEFKSLMDGYGSRYPTPDRDRRSFGQAEAAAAGFSFHSETFSHLVGFSQDQLVAYLLTHSNTISVTDAGRETPQDVATWLHEQLAPLLPDGEVGEFVFGGEIKVLSALS